MARLLIVLIVALVAFPATAGAGPLFAADRGPCFASGNVGYRFTNNSRADFTIRIEADAKSPDITVQLVDDAAEADFVLVEDGETADGCDGATAIRTIHVDAKASEPDLTISLSQHAAPYKIYASSREFSAQHAAALFAVMWKTTGKRSLAQRR